MMKENFPNFARRVSKKKTSESTLGGTNFSLVVNAKFFLGSPFFASLLEELPLKGEVKN
jgi:hypothetical protein